MNTKEKSRSAVKTSLSQEYEDVKIVPVNGVRKNYSLKKYLPCEESTPPMRLEDVDAGYLY